MKKQYKVSDRLALHGKQIADADGYVAGQIELTSKCYQKCSFCDSWREDQEGESGRWDSGRLENFLEELRAMPTFRHLSFTGGDPQSYAELSRILQYYLRSGLSSHFELQANTALARPWNPGEPQLWREAFSDVRVSLDAFKPETYQKMRGVDDMAPELIIHRAEQLKGLRYTFLMCVTELNVDEMSDLYGRVSRMDNPPRKVVFLPVIGGRGFGGVPLWFKASYSNQARRCYAIGREREAQTGLEPIEVSCSEDALEVRKQLSQPDAYKDVGCWTGAKTFHIKATGDVYPCCLVGGEALQVQKEFSLGNVFYQSLASVFQKAKTPRKHYKQQICREICQYKQFQINLAAERASKQTLAMP